MTLEELRAITLATAEDIRNDTHDAIWNARTTEEIDTALQEMRAKFRNVADAIAALPIDADTTNDDTTTGTD